MQARSTFPNTRPGPSPAHATAGGSNPRRNRHAAMPGCRSNLAKPILTAALGMTLPMAEVQGGPESAKAAVTELSPPTRPIQWKVKIGAAFRHLGDIIFQSGSYASPGMLPAFAPVLGAGRVGSVGELGVGPLGAFADRTYLDGFVFMDAQTSNPASFLSGTTAYWGYQANSQVQSGSLCYAGGEYATATAQGNQGASPGDWSSGFEGSSPVVELEGWLPLNDHLSVGGTVGFLFTSADSAHSTSTFRAFRSLSESAYSVTDRFALQGVVPPLAPYSGTFNPPGTAPLIDNIPTERIISNTGNSMPAADFGNRVKESIEIDLYTLSLGPTVRYETNRFVVTGGLGLTINIADWDAAYAERLDQGSMAGSTELRRWQEHNEETEVLPGFYLQGSVGYQLTEACQVSVFGRYDWSKSLSGHVGPSSFSADLGGYTLGGAFTFNF
ncbi:MAG: hypothetical protein NTW21_36435 [Verrucomicrobia bacterium]|nr:hypothetical protein [Verrucomicrobiota bacterium]